MDTILARLRVAIEENANGAMVHLVDLPGAFARGRAVREALAKAPREATQYHRWLGYGDLPISYGVDVVQRETNAARLDDADTEILLAAERTPDAETIQRLCRLAIKSAADFQLLYDSLPDKTIPDPAKQRKTFYGDTPASAEQMLEHADEVRWYYLGRIGLQCPEGDRGFLWNRCDAMRTLLESGKAFEETVFEADGESWTVTKVLRRLLWHDRIHARAMYRLAARQWGASTIANPFWFC